MVLLLSFELKQVRARRFVKFQTSSRKVQQAIRRDSSHVVPIQRAEKLAVTSSEHLPEFDVNHSDVRCNRGD